ncbi:unnamed protein product [Bursaphelenchus okinawaensis]|uniref:Uncharacterized protein n=1 Tax=Bursaphelenchus okinawaensis TaxID=465554 RepID=A0A811L914_9BILA|nr:unnamed protein product [Bursaphelenchus okinawaensis]CAG9120016.1 unnamed protein product [Bursaphelenchus okinawaensis]
MFWAYIVLLWACLSTCQSDIDIKDLLPDELNDLLENLSSAEEERFATSDGVDDPELSLKLLTSHQQISEKTRKLNPPARDFLNDMFGDLYEIDDSELKTISKRYLKRWNGLPEAEKNSLKSVFPKIYTVLNSPEFAKIADS